MKNVIWLFIIELTILLSNTNAAIQVDARDRLLKFHGSGPRHVRYKRSTTSIADIFGLTTDEEFEIKARQRTAHGFDQYKMVEKYKGKSVFDTVVTMTSDGDTPLTARGYFVQDIHKDTRHHGASLKKEDLFNILIKYNKDEKIVSNIGSRKIRRDFYLDDSNIARRVAILEYLIQTKEVLKRPTAIIDIKTGEVIRSWNNLATCRSYMKGRVFGGNYKVGRVNYGINPLCLEMKQSRGLCYLENAHVKVVDMYNTEFDEITDTAKFYCFRRYGDRINGAYSPAVDALYHGTVVGKMFEDWFQMKPLRNSKIILRVHYSHLFTNAFWNGRNCSFGDGVPGVSYPFTSLDIIGHEIAHGFTEQNAGLMYINEAGAINEAFSDITGEMAELYADVVDWRVGYAIKVTGSMRYFDNPEKDHGSISHIGQYRDGMNIHESSGIFNYVFYLLAYDYELLPQEVYKVFLHANRMYWHPLTNFISGACDIMMSAYDLGQPGEPFKTAFSKVGIDACDIDDHVIYLRPNVTQINVTVSRHINPIFALELPIWAGKIVIKSRCTDADVLIHVYRNLKWDTINDSTPALARGFSKVQFTLPRRYTNRSFLVRMSINTPKTVTNAKVRAEYSCADHFYTHDNELRKYYLWECYGIDAQNSGQNRG